MNKKVLKAINAQVKEEIFSAYLYLSMSAYCSSLTLDGFANWFMVQYKEEMDHAMGIYQFILDRGDEVELQAIAQPAKDFKIKTIFAEALKHEEFITGKIHSLYELAQKEKDYPLENFLRWYVEEQVEEEANANALVDKMKRVGNDNKALMMFDQELAARVHTPGGPNVA
jgi:ferritin